MGAQLCGVGAPRALALEIPILLDLPPAEQRAHDEGGVVDENLLSLPDVSLGLHRDPPVLYIQRVLSVGGAGVVYQAEHREQRSAVSLPEHDGIHFQHSDCPQNLVLNDLEI